MDPNTIQLPSELYDAVRRRAAVQQRYPDALVTEWVAEQLDTVEADEVGDGFEEEAAAMEVILTKLPFAIPGRDWLQAYYLRLNGPEQNFRLSETPILEQT